MDHMWGHLSDPSNEGNFLNGKMLIAMPSTEDERFERTLIYLCIHNADGAMGIVVNKPAPNITMPELLDQLSITMPGSALTYSKQAMDCPVLVGGPVEAARGFVLHSQDYYSDDSTVPVDSKIGLTASVDILRAIANGHGPDRALLALGYAGWGPGQLEAEMQANGWLHCDSDSELLFGQNLGAKYHSAMAKLGVRISELSAEAGHA
jgi:putative transcriptional regulator